MERKEIIGRETRFEEVPHESEDTIRLNKSFFTQQSENTLTVSDFPTGKVLWTVNTIQKVKLHHPGRLCITADGSAMYVPFVKKGFHFN